MKYSGVFLALVVFLSGCATQHELTAPRAEPAPRPVVAQSPFDAPAVWPADAPSIHAKSAILIDARTGKVLYQKYADMHTPPASTQKLLTALLVVEQGDLNRMVQIVPSDTKVEPTKLGVTAGQYYSRRSLLTAMLVASQNDAAAALGREHSGNTPDFVAEMNRRARELGATDSLFLNAHGLPAPQYSTARDISRIAFAAYHDPTIRGIVGMRSWTFTYASGRTKQLNNTNKLLKRSWDFTGMKTGYTFAAGKCLVASISSNNRELIFVQLGSKLKDIFDDAERMLRWGVTQ